MADLKALTNHFYDEVVNGRNLEAIDDLVTPNFVEHEALPGMANDASGVKQFFTMVFEAFPDLRIEVHDLIVEGDKVAARCTMSGTHKGTFMDIPATGKGMSVQVIDIIRFEGEKAAEHWGVTDQAAMMEQLGVAPQ
ncbi:MAG TPA: ester cyclase [Dehalococcoidia bacterium]